MERFETIPHEVPVSCYSDDYDCFSRMSSSSLSSLALVLTLTLILEWMATTHEVISNRCSF